MQLRGKLPRRRRDRRATLARERSGDARSGSGADAAGAAEAGGGVGGGGAAGSTSPASSLMIASGVPTGTFSPGLDEDLLDDAVHEDLDLDVRLVRLDLGDDVAAAHGVARLLVPLDERAGRHIGAKDRHQEFGHVTRTSPAPCARS